MEEILENLMPDELEKLKNKIEKLLHDLGIERTTNQKYQLKVNQIVCPRCNDNNVCKNGHKNKTQRYKCKKCNKFFSINTGTILSHSKLNYNQLKVLIKGLIDRKTLEELSFDLNMSMRETYNLRIKIISVFKEYTNGIILKDVIKADEKYFRISFKGTRKKNMPRNSRKSGSQDRKCGISKEQVCVVGAIDSYDNIILKIVGLGPVSTAMIKKALNGKIENGSILITDGKTGYRKFAKGNHLILKQIPEGHHKIEQYDLGEINSLFNEIENFVRNFHGLSTRHLQEYIDWFLCLKIMKYTLEYLEREENLYEFTISQKSNLISRNVCKTKMPVDISEVYEDINQHFVS